jgi:AraC-like DNA-binding protein
VWWNRIIASSTTQRPWRMLNNFEFRRLPNCLTVGREINWTGFSRRSDSREPVQVGAQNLALKHKAGELAFASQRARVSDSCGNTPRSGRTRTIARPNKHGRYPTSHRGPLPRVPASAPLPEVRRDRRVRRQPIPRTSSCLTLEDLAGSVNLSVAHFRHAFRTSTGQNPHQFVLRHRIERAKEIGAWRRRAMMRARVQAQCSSRLHPGRLGGSRLCATRASAGSHNRELNRSNGKIQRHPRRKSALERTDPTDSLVFQLKRHAGARRVVG